MSGMTAVGKTASGVRTVIVAIAALTLAACAPAVVSEPATTLSVPPDTSKTFAPSPPPDPKPAVAWTLTGTDAAGVGPAELERPALSIKIENSADARPQKNLQFADVVYEEYVEYGISRLVAVYHSNWPETVGPIRSMRPMDKNIIGSYDGPLIFSGAQRRFIAENAAVGQEQISQDLGDYGFFRVSDKPSPHNLHGTLEDFHEQTDAGAPPAQWEFAYPAGFATAQLEGTEVSHLDIYMSGRAQPDWKWDAEAGLWMRYEDTTPHVTVDGTQLSATNVVILSVRVQYTSANGGSSVPETLLTGESGSGWLVSGNKMVEIDWSKKGRTDPIALTTKAGDAVSLMPGQTWVELVPYTGVGHSTDVEIS
jgi:hypothetical protein